MKVKIIIGIVCISLFSVVFLCNGEVEEKKFLEDKVVQNLVIAEDESAYKVVSNPVITQKERRETAFFEMAQMSEIEEVVVEDVDFDSFIPSYNLFVTKALMEKCNVADKYYSWFNIKDDRKAEFDESCLFLNYCAYQVDILNTVIPSTHNLLELETYYKDKETFFKGCQSCYPIIGDLILFDDNYDNVSDRVGIISFVSESDIRVVGLNQNCTSHQSMEVAEGIYSFSDSRIYGYCRPNYGYLRIENFKDAGLPFNAVDTVTKLKDQEYADVLAANGIEVIARYINPEGRNPLTVDEIEMFSRAGVRVMMIYQVNKDDPYKGYEKGIELGTRALQYASDLGAPEGMPIFFCCDCNNRPENLSSVVEFINGVRDSMQGKYSVGLYGGFYTCEAMYNLGLLDAYWQCWGYSDKYLSNNFDMIQYTGGIKFFDDIPYYFDANYVKYPEKVSFIYDVVD